MSSTQSFTPRQSNDIVATHLPDQHDELFTRARCARSCEYYCLWGSVCVSVAEWNPMLLVCCDNHSQLTTKASQRVFGNQLHCSTCALTQTQTNILEHGKAERMCECESVCLLFPMSTPTCGRGSRDAFAGLPAANRNAGLAFVLCSCVSFIIAARSTSAGRKYHRCTNTTFRQSNIWLVFPCATRTVTLLLWIRSRSDE